MTDEEIKAIRARLEFLPEGPWDVRDGGDWVHVADGSSSIAYPNWMQHDFKSRRQIAQFIAHARTDVPKLLDELKVTQNALKDILQDGAAAYLRGWADLAAKIRESLRDFGWGPDYLSPKRATSEEIKKKYGGTLSLSEAMRWILIDIRPAKENCPLSFLSPREAVDLLSKLTGVDFEIRVKFDKKDA